MLFVILYEEPSLTATFDATYERYLSTVPRWILNGNWRLGERSKVRLKPDTTEHTSDINGEG